MNTILPQQWSFPLGRNCATLTITGPQELCVADLEALKEMAEFLKQQIQRAKESE